VLPRYTKCSTCSTVLPPTAIVISGDCGPEPVFNALHTVCVTLVAVLRGHCGHCGHWRTDVMRIGLSEFLTKLAQELFRKYRKLE